MIIQILTISNDRYYIITGGTSSDISGRVSFTVVTEVGRCRG